MHLERAHSTAGPCAYFNLFRVRKRAPRGEGLPPAAAPVVCMNPLRSKRREPMPRVALLGILSSILACSAANKEMPSGNALARKGVDQALFVGHTNTGLMVVAARHADAMNGMAVL